MAQNVPPEKAAKQIIDMIAGGTAKDAADAVAQKPELASGKQMLESAVAPAKASPIKAAAKKVVAAAKPTGSGPPRLSR